MAHTLTKKKVNSWSTLSRVQGKIPRDKQRRASGWPCHDSRPHNWSLVLLALSNTTAIINILTTSMNSK